jgi:hypothetical protein
MHFCFFRKLYFPPFLTLALSESSQKEVFPRAAILLHTIFDSSLGDYAQPVEQFMEHEGIIGTWYTEFERSIRRKPKISTMASGLSGRTQNPFGKKGPDSTIPQILQDVGFDLVFEQLDWFGGKTAHEMISGVQCLDKPRSVSRHQNVQKSDMWSGEAVANK